MKLKTNDSDVTVFNFSGKPAPENAVFNDHSPEELRGNVSVEIYDRETGRCQCVGMVTEAYEYGGVKIISVWDSEEPLAWAMMVNDDNSVTHYDRVCDVLVLDERMDKNDYHPDDTGHV